MANENKVGNPINVRLNDGRIVEGKIRAVIEVVSMNFDQPARAKQGRRKKKDGMLTFYWLLSRHKSAVENA